MPVRTLSILIPCYNERNAIAITLQKVVETNCGLLKEIIVINDGSADDSSAVIEKFILSHPDNNIQQLHHQVNKGKGACIQTALSIASGEIIIIQDADLEYDPSEYTIMLKPVLNGFADVVYGSRFRGSEAHRVLFFFHTIGNKLLTFISNVLTGLNLTDMETGYKLFKTDVLKQISLKEKRFGFEPEVTAKISKMKNIRIYEVGISYYGRTYYEGKKIKWKDGLKAIYCVFKYNLFSRK